MIFDGSIVYCSFRIYSTPPFKNQIESGVEGVISVVEENDGRVYNIFFYIRT